MCTCICVRTVVVRRESDDMKDETAVYSMRVYMMGKKAGCVTSVNRYPRHHRPFHTPAVLQDTARYRFALLGLRLFDLV